MDVKFINPFINSVVAAIETMLGMPAERMAPTVKNDSIPQGDISGIIGFAASNIYGSVALSFPTATALKIYNKMMNESLTAINDDVRDIVGELANIVAGGAKKEYSEMRLSFDISIPTVVMGNAHTITHKAGTPVVIVPFKLEGSSFVMEISMKVRTGETAVKAPDPASMTV